MNFENNTPKDHHTEGNSNFDDIGSNDNNTTDAQSASQIPLPGHDSVTFQTPKPRGSMMNISFLCNPSDEHINLRQPSTSELFDDDLSLVQKRSWAKDSTCK